MVDMPTLVFGFQYIDGFVVPGSLVRGKTATAARLLWDTETDVPALLD